MLNSVREKLTSETPLINLKLYVVIIIVLFVGSILFLVFLLCKKRNKRRISLTKCNSAIIPIYHSEMRFPDDETYEDDKKITTFFEEAEKRSDFEKRDMWGCSVSVKINDDKKKNIGWGRWYSLKELEKATFGFSDENVIGEGGFGVVYKGVLEDESVVAIKNLLNNKGQAEKEFKVEVEAIGKVRHKNLVGLIGYCVEGAKRMLVYEYVDNGNLEQWLHGDVESVSPLTWDIRMKIAVGTAKGLAYLHEGLEPKVVHRDVKSSNILLDRKWTPKVSDFGLAKLLGSEKSHVTTRVMGTFGYVSPEYACTGMLNEMSDVYSFGVLLMEIITGRTPVDYSRSPGEMNLVDWFKGTVADRRGEELLDPLIEVKPNPRLFKRVLLVCLRCIDPDVRKRPKMGQVVHMLESEQLRFSRCKSYLT